ncbi:MAG TPA: alpha/beta fold hydrolase [Thermosynechococcaceae cyanobacterium]
MSISRGYSVFFWKLFTGIGLFAAIAYLTVCLFLRLRQAHFMFFPTRTIESTPADLNLNYEDVWVPVTTRDGTAGGKTEKMHGWWIPAAAPRGVVLHLHGNGYNVGANLGQVRRFHQLNYTVLLVDYRGYGWSEGDFPTETRLYQDAEAQWNYLTQSRRVPPEQVFLFGHSLGGAIAIDLALRHPEAAGLIVQSSFTRMRAMVDQLGHYWMFPIDLLLTQRFDSLQKVRSLRLPVLYLHGAADGYIPPSMSDQLYDATPQPKWRYFVENGRHNDVAEVGGDRYLEALREFMSRDRAKTSSLNEL